MGLLPGESPGALLVLGHLFGVNTITGTRYQADHGL